MRLYGAGADADCSNVVALVLDFVSRPTKDGCTPVLVFDQRGTDMI